MRTVAPSPSCACKAGHVAVRRRRGTSRSRRRRRRRQTPRRSRPVRAKRRRAQAAATLKTSWWSECKESANTSVPTLGTSSSKCARCVRWACWLCKDSPKILCLRGRQVHTSSKHLRTRPHSSPFERCSILSERSVSSSPISAASAVRNCVRCAICASVGRSPTCRLESTGASPRSR